MEGLTGSVGTFMRDALYAAFDPPAIPDAGSGLGARFT